ncbi:odorant receptor 43a-like [Schistocerca gregaria]|uniref:odorant receptor 43a-like n=1 Tax=Schistocerca gregaria TaxID=7010 RepID=UPI00211EA1CE|nr:odorant receptor 43a-like [Schistocerca gregaria]
MEHPSPDSDSLLGPGATLRRLMGLWQPRGRAARLLNGLLACMTLACITFLALCVVLRLYMDPPEELEQITLCCLVASICVGFFCKASLFMAQGGTLRQTVGLLEDIRLQFCRGDNNQLTRHRYHKLSNNVYCYCQMVAIPAVIGWVLCPLLSRIITKTDPDQQEPQRQLPVPAWLPADIYASPTFELLYVAQSFSVMVITESCLSIDVFFVHMMLMVAAELEVLNDNLSAMEFINLQTTRTEGEGFIDRRKRNGRRLTLLNSGQNLGEQTLTTNSALEGLHQQLVKNVHHHQAILRFVSLLQSAMNVSIFSLLFVNMANLCSSLFVAGVLLQKEGNIGKALNAFFSIPALLYETVIYCIYGHIMTDQSERLVYSAFSSGWVDGDARFKRSMVIFMMVTVRPMAITVGKTCKLSKQMLLQVLNGTYGLLNMLYHVHRSE